MLSINPLIIDVDNIPSMSKKPPMEEDFLARCVFARNVAFLLSVHPDLNTQTKLQAATKMAQSSMSNALNIESGPKSVLLSTIARIAKAFGITAWQLLDPDLGSYYNKESAQREDVQLARVSIDEYELLQWYRSAADMARMSIVVNAKAMAENQPRESNILLMVNTANLDKA